MPITSKRQWGAMFGGHIPGISKAKAKEWAHETPTAYADLPDRAPDEKGKPTLRSKHSSTARRVGILAKMLSDQLHQPGTHKNLYDAARGEHDRRKHAGEQFVEHCMKLAFAVPAPGKTFQSAAHVGSFSGKATTNFLKAPGPTTAAAVVNPRLGLRTAMTKAMRAT